MDRNVLLIVASGKSSRFGGFPKAFCHIGENTVAKNIIVKAGKIYDKIYIGVNKSTYSQFADKVEGCEMFSIVTGCGDAHSILKCLTYIKEREPGLKKIMICWGDTVFVDDTPFRQLLVGAHDAKVAVACAMDDRPYAWFETDADNGIRKSHFAMKEGFIERGIHDQSLFLLDLEFAIRYLNEYRELLGIPYDNDEECVEENEMKLLYFFEFLYESGYECAKCVEVVRGKALSFNTGDELEVIKRKIGVQGRNAALCLT